MFADLTEVDRIESDFKVTVPGAFAMIVQAVWSRLHFPLDSRGRVARPKMGRLQRTPAQRPARAPCLPGARDRTENHHSLPNRLS